ncbi:MAG: hypothetical protein P4L85_12005 [Paludisphaera borealis]|uniref:hypothetical protein n=1 Tax=Paludisphaera borealis TaxID=1387353 RepID=UPI00284C2FA0|nr:hypothetical protein [Paludisphaera borealis]MDR3620066.1 hypothetical protein [Paludisphaera borealis]
MIDHLSTSQSHGPRPSRRRPSRIVRTVPFLIALAAVAAAAIVPTAARAAMPVEIENLRVGFGADNVFKIGAWTPVWVQLKGGANRFTGFMDVVASDDDGIPTAFRQAVDLPAGETRRFAGYIRPGGRDTDVTLRFFDESGRWLGEREQGRTMPMPPKSVMPYESLIVIAGQPQGIDQIPTAAGFQQAGSTIANSGDAEIVVTRLDIDGDRVPGRWYGFDGAQAVVLDTSDRATLDMIDGLRGQALVEWIKRGGHLVISVGANWQAVRDSVLGAALPAVPAGQERVQSLEALDTFAGSSKSITPPQSPRQMITKLEQLDERGGKALSSVANLPVVVRGAHGFGRITLIGVDVDQKIFSDWPDRGLFWIRALDLKRSRADHAASPAMPGGGRFYASGVTDLASQLRVALEQFPRVKLIPFGWVAFLIFLYVLAIGPGDYLFLKRVVKRMELTWITFPAIVVVVSLLAYYAAYRLKGDDLLVNKIDVVDVDQVSGLTRGRSWATLFSPQNRDYGIGFLPASLDAAEAVAPAVLVGPGAEPPRPEPGTEVVTSWFSIPENQFGAMGGANRRFSFGGGGYSYEPVNSTERLKNVRIPIWSTKTVTARWFGSSGPLVESDLQPYGADRLAGTVVNRLGYPLEGAVLAFGKQVYTIGDIAPGQTINVQLTDDRNLSGLLRENEKNYLPEQGRDRDLKLDRADLMLAVMFHDSEGSRTNERALGNSTLHDLDLTGQLALQRPMLVARIKRPAARLALENAPSEPKVDQTTVLRIILPLKHPKKGASVAAR